MKARPPSELEKLLSTDPGQNIILRSLDVMDYSRLRLANYSMFQFFQNLPADFWLDKLEYFLAHRPDERRVRFILKRNLNFLNFEFKEVKFPLYTVTNATPLQLVHGAGDIEMRDETLKPLFEERYGSKEKGIEEMQKQISEMKNVHKRFDFGPIIQAISNELFNHGKDAATNKWILSPAFLAAYEKFQTDYAAHQHKTIDKGMQFRWETLQELSDAYRDAAALWNHDNKKCALLEDAVLAEVLRYATKNDKERFNQGLYYLQKDRPEPFKRSQKTRDGYDFDEALKKQSSDFLLNSSCVDIIYAGRSCVGWPLRAAGLHVYKIFVEQKLQACRTYAATPTNEDIRMCNSLT